MPREDIVWEKIARSRDRKDAMFVSHRRAWVDSFSCRGIIDHMELNIVQYIQKLLQKAHYEYDPSVKDWVGWVAGYPGVYAQGRTVEDVRADLVSVLEDFLVMDLQEGKKIPGVSVSSRVLKARHSADTYAAADKL